MKDLALDSNLDLAIINNDFDFVFNSEALIQELKVFLNIRAAHTDNNGKIIFPGELEYDQNQGIDFIFVFAIDTTLEQIKNHYIKKILTYYNEFITEISTFDISIDRVEKKININFTYKTIWSNEDQLFKIEVK